MSAISFFILNNCPVGHGLLIYEVCNHSKRRAADGRTPLDEWSARRRDLYLTTLTTDKRPCHLWDSNPQPQQASGRRPTLMSSVLAINIDLHYWGGRKACSSTADELGVSAWNCRRPCRASYKENHIKLEVLVNSLHNSRRKWRYGIWDILRCNVHTRPVARLLQSATSCIVIAKMLCVCVRARACSFARIDVRKCIRLVKIWGPVAGCCDHGNEHLFGIKTGGIRDFYTTVSFWTEGYGFVDCHC